MTESITAGTEQWMRQMQQAEQALNNGKQGSGGSDDKMSQALAQVRALREQLQAQSRQDGQLARGSGQPGQQPGEAMQRGSESRSGGGRPTMGGGANDQDMLRDLYALRSQFGRGDRQLNEYFDDAIGSLGHAPGQAGL